MSHTLSFSRFAEYDAGQPGITVAADLKLGKESVTCQAKIDTGSTFCVFARHLGEELGFDIERGMRQLISTATGVFVTYQHSLTLSIMSFDFDVLACFAEDASFQINVLGRRGFLDQVRLGLVDYEGKLYLSQYLEE